MKGKANTLIMKQDLLREIVSKYIDHFFPNASGTSPVAIDNKIEQAMDLVKSHLMYAVREEVEVLKEKIAELMDRIGQLEAENTLLKAHASQETLAQLGGTKASQQQQPPPASAQPPVLVQQTATAVPNPAQQTQQPQAAVTAPTTGGAS